MNNFKIGLFTLAVMSFSLVSSAQGNTQPAQTLFSDNFNRAELGDKWLLNDKIRKVATQSRIIDSVLVITKSPQSDHGAVARVNVKFTDVKVNLKFKLTDNGDFNLNADDPDCKTVHAGHICRVKINQHQVVIQDDKTGIMNLDIKSKLENPVEAEKTKQFLKTKSKSFPVKLAPDKWHELSMTIVDDEITVVIDGAEIGPFASGGIAHSDKKALALSTNKQALFDDFEVTTVH